jgi:transposase-like protein
VEELLAERGIEVDHVTVHRWVRRFGPLLVDAARSGRQRVGDRRQVDETYVKVAGRGPTCLGRSTSSGQVIDVYGIRRGLASHDHAVIRWHSGSEPHPGVVTDLGDTGRKGWLNRGRPVPFGVER